MIVATLAGCGGPAEPAVEGATCFRAKDCQPGLICLEFRCTSNIESLVPEGAGTPADAGAP